MGICPPVLRDTCLGLRMVSRLDSKESCGPQLSLETQLPPYLLRPKPFLFCPVEGSVHWLEGS